MEIYITLLFYFFMKTKCKLLVEEIKIYLYICESNILQIHITYFKSYSYLGPELYVSISCWKYKWQKMKITHHKFVGDGCIGEGISLMNACRVSQSVLYQVLNAVSDVVMTKK